MRKINNKSGFTLIEIIVVLIIVGILAAIALPNLFSNVSKSRAEEALATISSWRPTMETCIMAHPTATSANCTNALIPLGATTNFTYVVTAPANATDTGYSIKASGQSALAATDTITMTRAAAVYPATGAMTCVAAGNLSGAC